MKFRKLRIAWSVAWGISCVLLVVLWVRSYRNQESCYMDIPPQQIVGATSTCGHLILAKTPLPTLPGFQSSSRPHWGGSSLGLAKLHPSMTYEETVNQIGLPSFPGLSYSHAGKVYRFVVADWLPIVLFAAFGAMPGCRGPIASAFAIS